MLGPRPTRPHRLACYLLCTAPRQESLAAFGPLQLLGQVNFFAGREAVTGLVLLFRTVVVLLHPAKSGGGRQFSHAGTWDLMSCQVLMEDNQLVLSDDLQGIDEVRVTFAEFNEAVLWNDALHVCLAGDDGQRREEESDPEWTGHDLARFHNLIFVEPLSAAKEQVRLDRHRAAAR